MSLDEGINLQGHLTLDLEIRSLGVLEAHYILDSLLQRSVLRRQSGEVRIQDQELSVNLLHISRAKFLHF